MVLVQSESLLAEISADEPSGKDLEYDAEFLALVTAARSAPQERLVGPSGPGEEPNWKNVAERATALFARTKDLRVASVLVKTWLRMQGFAGLANGVGLLRSLIERFWDTVHPQLDPADKDPTMRINALRELCDRAGLLAFLRSVPLVSLAGIGSFSLRDLAAVGGEAAAAAGSATPDSAKIELAFANCDLQQLSATHDALESSLADLRAVESWVTEKVGAHHALSFEELTGILEQMQRLLKPRLAQRRAEGSHAAADPTDALGDVGDADPSGAALVTAKAAVQRVAVGDIASRADVTRVLEQVCKYYELNEPSSPVPLLLRRAQRLSSMSFLDIVRDLAPDGSAQVEVIRGPQGADNT
jgi:type VI secretion system protein ImpA